MAVYFIQAGEGGPVKIGISQDPWARLRKLQSDQDKPTRLIRLFDGGLVEEGVLHHRFAEHRLHGEWFAPATEILTGEIGLPPLRLDRPRKGPIGWTEESYRKFYIIHARRLEDPRFLARRKESAAKTGARIGMRTHLDTASQAIDVIQGQGEFREKHQARRALRAALARMEHYHAAFPALLEDARRDAANPLSHTARRLVEAAQAFAAHAEPVSA